MGNSVAYFQILRQDECITVIETIRIYVVDKMRIELQPSPYFYGLSVECSVFSML